MSLDKNKESMYLEMTDSDIDKLLLNINLTSTGSENIDSISELDQCDALDQESYEINDMNHNASTETSNSKKKFI